MKFRVGEDYKHRQAVQLGLGAGTVFPDIVGPIN